MIISINPWTAYKHEHEPTCPKDNCKICNKEFFVCDDSSNNFWINMGNYNNLKDPITNFCHICRNRIKRKHNIT